MYIKASNFNLPQPSAGKPKRRGRTKDKRSSYARKENGTGNRENRSNDVTVGKYPSLAVYLLSLKVLPLLKYNYLAISARSMT